MKTVLKWIMVGVLVAAIAGVGGVAGIFYYYGRDLPELLTRDDFDPPQMSRILAANGEIIGEFYTPGARRTVVPEEKIPDTVRNAFLAAEDADFMVHQGIDYVGLIRAFYNAVRYDSGIKGTSTITQQVVKNLVLSPERSIARKIKEIILAREIEQNLTKDDILFLYLNTIYLGHGVNGVQEAAQSYYGKNVWELDLVEASTLAGLTQSPERLTPRRHPERAKDRRSYVLRQMWQKGFITEAAYREADEAPVSVASASEVFPHLGIAPHFVERVRKTLEERYGQEEVIGGGLRVHTTLDVEAQRLAVDALRDGLQEYDKRKKLYQPIRTIESSQIDDYLESAARRYEGSEHRVGDRVEALVLEVGEDNSVKVQIGSTVASLDVRPLDRVLRDAESLGDVLSRGDVVGVEVVSSADSLGVRFAPGPDGALIAIDPETRHVLAMVGGYDFETNNYDHATQAARQTGSTFKPFVYAAALESKTITPASIYLDSPTCFQLDTGTSWCPKNSDGTWRGPIRIREGLGASRNVVAVRVLQDVGIEDAVDFARRVGIESNLVENFTMVMGSSEVTPMEMTNAYATLASSGVKSAPILVERVESVKGTRDVFETQSERTIAPQVTYLVSHLMLAGTGGYTDSEGRRRGGTAGSISKLGHEVAGKTGTTNEAKDAWFIGYTPRLVAGVWVGYSDNTSLGAKEYGGRVAAPIWLDFMEKMHEDVEERLEFEPPTTGISVATIDPKTGKLAREGGIEESFLVGTTPTEYAPEEDESGSHSDFVLGQFEDE